MMAKADDRGAARPVRLWVMVATVLVPVVLAFVALRGLSGLHWLAKALIHSDTLTGPWAPRVWSIFATNLALVLGAVAGILWLKPWATVARVAAASELDEDPAPLNAAILAALLGFVALSGFAAAAGVLGAVLFDPRIDRPANWLTWAHFAVFLAIGFVAARGLFRLRPWAKRAPLSPATRKTNFLFGLSGAVGVAACLPLIILNMSQAPSQPMFSNGPLPHWIALYAIPVWLLSWAIGWWWYFTADEHEQRASDVGLLFAGGVFATVAPAWWIAARAGLMPHPDAMVLWLAFNVIWAAGWFWRRNR